MNILIGDIYEVFDDFPYVATALEPPSSKYRHGMIEFTAAVAVYKYDKKGIDTDVYFPGIPWTFLRQQIEGNDKVLNDIREITEPRLIEVIVARRDQRTTSRVREIPYKPSKKYPYLLCLCADWAYLALPLARPLPEDERRDSNKILAHFSGPDLQNFLSGKDVLVAVNRKLG